MPNHSIHGIYLQQGARLVGHERGVAHSRVQVEHLFTELTKCRDNNMAIAGLRGVRNPTYVAGLSKAEMWNPDLSEQGWVGAPRMS